MKKLLLLVLFVLSTTGIFAQNMLADLYQENSIKRNLYRKYEQSQIDQLKELFSPETQKIYKALSLQEKSWVDKALLTAAMTKEEIATRNWPAPNKRMEVWSFVDNFKDLYDIQLLYKPKTPISLIITEVLYKLEFTTKDNHTFKINNFLQAYDESFYNLEKLVQAKLVLWHAQLTLDEMELGL